MSKILKFHIFLTSCTSPFESSGILVTAWASGENCCHLSENVVLYR